MTSTFRFGTVALSLIATAAAAQGVRTVHDLSLDLANQLATQAVATCATNGYAVSATVVDRSGAVRAVQRADNAGPHTLGASERKAYTAASAKNSTQVMFDNGQKNPAAANLGQIPGFLLLGGGLPVKVGNETIGAIGVGGAPAPHLDEQCAQAAIDKVKDLLK